MGRECTYSYTLGKGSKYIFFSGPYFTVFSRNTGKYGPEKSPYLDTFCAVIILEMLIPYL